MNTMVCFLGIVFLGLFGTSDRAVADVHKVLPKDAIVLPDDGSGSTRVALLFDLSGLRAGENRRIGEAVLDWRVSGIGSEELPQFVAYEIIEPWSSTSVKTGSVPSLESGLISDGQVNALVTETSEGKFLRMDMTEVVRKWAAGITANYGVVLATPDLGAKVLNSQLAKIQLTVRYGFIDN